MCAYLSVSGEAKYAKRRWYVLWDVRGGSLVAWKYAANLCVFGMRNASSRTFTTVRDDIEGVPGQVSHLAAAKRTSKVLEDKCK